MAKQAIIIMVDTQRTDMVSSYPNAFLKTQNIDKIAQEGVVYTKGFTTQPVCGPARSAIFTGLYPHSNGMVSNCMQLGANVKTAGDWLTPNGIECAYIGKWHLDGGDYFGYGKCPSGYNPKYWYDMRNYLDELSPQERLLSRKNMSARNDDPKEDDTFAHRCANRAIEFVEEFKEKDFFLTLSLDEPHDPSVCPKKFVTELKRGKFKLPKTPNVRASLEDKPEHHRVWARLYGKIPFKILNRSQRGTFACNGFCDYEIGRLLNKIEECKIKPLIIYTADHGDMFLSHGLLGKGCVMYNEITNVPFIISGSGFEKGISNLPVSHIDILPTVMEHLGQKIPRMLQGESLQNLDKNQKREIFIEFTRYEVDHDGFMGYQPIRCVFDGRFKLVVNLLTTDELYDLDTDPYEMRNLILDQNYEQIRNELHDRLIKQMNDTRDVYRGYYWECRQWRKGVKPSFNHTGYTRQLEEEDFVQLDYSTGLPMKGSVRKK